MGAASIETCGRRGACRTPGGDGYAPLAPAPWCPVLTRTRAALLASQSVQRDYQNADGEAQIVNEWILCREAESHPLTDDPYFACPEGQLVFNAPTGPSGDEPPEVPSLRQTLEGYHRSMQFLAQKVYRCFALSLGLPEDFFVSKASRAPSWGVTIAHYPALPERPPEGVERINSHWDRIMFSLVTCNDEVAQRNGGGLQILLNERGDTLDASSGEVGQWHDVPLERGQFTINIGEVMSRWTNGVFKHVVHRVPNPEPGSEGNTGGHDRM